MQEVLEQLRDAALRRSVAFMDARADDRESTAAAIQDGKADKLSHSKTQGLGVRVLVDGAWGFATTNEVTKESAAECLDDAITMARASGARASALTELADVEPVIDTVEAKFERDPRSVPIAEKMAMLTTMEKAAVDACGDKLSNTIVSYGDSAVTEVLCNTRGTLLTQETVRTQLSASITAQEGAARQQYRERECSQQGYELIERLTPDDVPVKAAETAVDLLSARRAPSGKFCVVFHPTVTGLLTHEALGHNAEADLVLSGQSIIADKVGEKVAADCLSIIDDATLSPDSWGSYPYDSEGTPAQRRVIIENGVLRGYMHSLQTAAALGAAPNGSARADGYACRPLVRMSNTFIEPGETPLDELLAGVDEGILLKGGGWGYVMCERGQYTCNAGQGYWIRNGEVREQIRDVSISGMTLETLLSADAVSQDWEMTMPGMCGKGGQGMYINAGGPYVRAREVVVGGQE